MKRTECIDFALFQFYVKSPDGSKRKHVLLGLTLALTGFCLFESFRWFAIQGSYSIELVILVKTHYKVNSLHCPKTDFTKNLVQQGDMSVIL